jgi:hypothetical protein
MLEEFFGHRNPREMLERYNELKGRHELDRRSSRESEGLRKKLERIRYRETYRGQPLSALLKNDIWAALSGYNPWGGYQIRRSFKYESSGGNAIVANVLTQRTFEAGEVFEPLESEDSDPVLVELKGVRIRKIVSGQTRHKYSPPELVLYGVVHIESLAKRHNRDPGALYEEYILGKKPLPDIDAIQNSL